MMAFSPKLFVGLAFDSGGVSGGALTSAFLTPLTLGVAQAVATTSSSGGQSILVNGFGIIAFISVTPLIAVQFLGIVYNINIKKANKAIEDAELNERKELAKLASTLEQLGEHVQDKAIVDATKDIQIDDGIL
jgi:hypothetical protein